jgi:hypothetical protein
MNKEKKSEIVICGCHSSEHQLIIHHNGEDKQVYIHIYLAKRPFFKRVLAGFKYIFGYTSRYGHWDEMILEKEHAEQFQNLVDTLNGKQ